MFNFVVISGIVLSALVALRLARMVHIWFALRDILELPNVVRIHNDERSPFQNSSI
jgi:hypothetical protein